MGYAISILVLLTNNTNAQGHWSEPVKLSDSINTFFPPEYSGSVYHAHLSPDGSELYYTLADFEHGDDVYVARYNRDKGAWDSVTRLSVNTDDVRRELSPSITADHSRLFWCSWSRSGGYGAYDVWFAEWDNETGDWGQPKNAGPNVNSPGSEFTCFIAPDGKTLYVSSDYDSDCDDIFRYALQSDGTWGTREKVFEYLHPGYCEYDPWVSPDGMWLYFSMWTGGRTIWRSRWLGQYFGNTEMLPCPIFVNGDWQFNDGPSLNAEADRMYFSSNRPDSNGQWQYMWYSEYLEETVARADFLEVYDFRMLRSTRKSIKFSYSLPESSQVFCGIFDPEGNLVRIVTGENQGPGDHEYTWYGEDDMGRLVSSGAYFLRLTIDRARVIKKKIYLR